MLNERKASKILLPRKLLEESKKIYFNCGFKLFHFAGRAGILESVKVKGDLQTNRPINMIAVFLFESAYHSSLEHSWSLLITLAFEHWSKLIKA